MTTKKPLSISALLAKSGSRLGALQAAAEQAQSLHARIVGALPADLGSLVRSAAVDDQGLLTVVCANGAHATRLRYAQTALLAAVAGTAPAAVRVRVIVRADAASGTRQP